MGEDRGQMIEKIVESINLLDKWIEKNSWAGYDPYDIKGTKLFLHLQKNKELEYEEELDRLRRLL